MPGLMDFLEPFATGYLETKIAGQEKRAEYIQKQNELADAKLAEIAKNRAIQLDNLEIKNADLEEKRQKEEAQLLKQHGDMNPIVLKYLQDQNYFYDKATWTAFSEGFKTESGGSDKWYQQEVVGSGGISWQDMMAEQISKTFNKEDAKNAVDLPTNTKDLVMDFSIEDQPFSLLNPKSLNPTAIIDYNKSRTELSKSEVELSMLNFDEQNQEVIFNLDKISKENNNQLNALAIKSAEYDLETQPAKDFIDMQLNQADLLSKNINNASLRQKNTLTINQLEANIKKVEQEIGITAANKDLNHQKLKLTVENLKIENQMDALMLEEQPQINVLKLQKMQLDNIAQQIDNQTAGDIDLATLENIKKRNTQLGQNIDNFDEEQKLAFELQQKKIEKIEKELKEGPTVKMYDEIKLTKAVTDSVNSAIGVPRKGATMEGVIWDIDSMKSPWIKPMLNDVSTKVNSAVKEYFTQIKDGILVNKQVEQIDINNITNRILGEELLKQFKKSNTDGLQIVKEAYGKELNDTQIAEVTKAIFELHKNENISNNTKILTKYNIGKESGIFKQTAVDGGSINTNNNPWNQSMLTLINNYNKGQGFSSENDIR
jgi:hypothetical protein